MNLIQIKQIDGLQSALNQLSNSVFNLNEEIDNEFSTFDDFWGQLTWTENYIKVNSEGETVDGDDNISLRLEGGGLSTPYKSYFKGGIEVTGGFSLSSDLNLVSYEGQLNYITSSGEVKKFKDCINPTYSGVTTTSSALSSDNYIVGARTASAGGAITLTLPESVEAKEIIVKDESINASVDPVIVNCNGSETIDGKSSIKISEDGGFFTTFSNGSNWFVSNGSGISI
tara:strand:- start:418 stop:1101 length:684 start_codon:yes stop_codon:yes gene_type:complete